MAVQKEVGKSKKSEVNVHGNTFSIYYKIWCVCARVCVVCARACNDSLVTILGEIL